MSEQVTAALDEFIQKYLVTAKKHPEMLLAEYDNDWPSECYTSLDSKSDKDGKSDRRDKSDKSDKDNASSTNDRVDWQPVKRSGLVNFSDLEKALEMKIHEDIISYYSAYWSENLNAETDKGYLQLLQPLNQDDFERLQQNLVGHILMKRRLKQPETFFIALTDEDDFIITVHNTSGEVMLEQVGLEPKEVLAANLAVFIQSLQPSYTSP
jgi:SecY interacting protein Syd